MRALLLAPVLALAISVSAPTADAATNCTYYSDSTKTVVVGEFGTDCCNNKVARGRKSAYSTCSSGCLICYPPPV
jgi:hypothetical protein